MHVDRAGPAGDIVLASAGLRIVCVPFVFRLGFASLELLLSVGSGFLEVDATAPRNRRWFHQAPLFRHVHRIKVECYCLYQGVF